MPTSPRRPPAPTGNVPDCTDDGALPEGTPERRAIAVGAEPWRLPGVFTRPAGKQPCPGLVLIHGSGPNDRDHTVGPHRTFRELALGLARRGVATVRYDKRSHTYAARFASQLAPNTTLHQEAVLDGLAAHALAGRLPGIHRQRRFVLGYSLGGLAAVRVARADEGVRGLVLVASTPRPLSDCLLDQARYLASLEGPAGAEARTALPRLEGEAERINAIIQGTAPQLHEQALGKPASYWIDLAAHPMATALAQDPRPLLVIHPGRDFQVGEADLRAWRSLLASHPAAELRCYEQLNHLLVEGTAARTPSDWHQPGPLHPAVMDDIASFVERVG